MKNFCSKLSDGLRTIFGYGIMISLFAGGLTFFGYAAALIDQAGLKGYQVGGAAVSEKHAGFVVNLGGATASDVQELLSQVAKKVYADTGISLEPEGRIW